MEKYFKNIEGEYIVSLSTGSGEVKITQEEYEKILSTVRSRPTPEANYYYKLRTDFSWELVEIPVVEIPVVEDDVEATETDYQGALAEMGVDLHE